MRVTTTQYVRKPLIVDAVRITGANFDDVAAWCQGEIRQDEVPGKGTGKKYIRVRAHNPKNPRQTKAYVGDWLLYTERGYKVYTNKGFNAAFDEGTSEFPKEEGDTIVIGPECFVAKDGSVLCWKGVNYVPQERPGDVIMGDEELVPGVTLNEVVAMVKDGRLPVPEEGAEKMERLAERAA